MTEELQLQIRITALANAVQYHRGESSPGIVRDTAAIFAKFLLGEEAPAPATVGSDAP